MDFTEASAGLPLTLCFPDSVYLSAFLRFCLSVCLPGYLHLYTHLSISILYYSFCCSACNPAFCLAFADLLTLSFSLYFPLPQSFPRFHPLCNQVFLYFLLLSLFISQISTSSALIPPVADCTFFLNSSNPLYSPPPPPPPPSISLSLSLSLSPPPPPPLCLCLSVPPCRYVCLSLSFCLSMPVCLPLSLSLSLSHSLYLSRSLTVIVALFLLPIEQNAC